MTKYHMSASTTGIGGWDLLGRGLEKHLADRGYWENYYRFDDKMKLKEF